jgi:hypothetical protein
MDMIKLQNMKLQDELFDSENYFSIGYSAQLGRYIMIVYVNWVIDYQRYFGITKDDYLSYKSNKSAFISKHYDVLHCITGNIYFDNFLGASAIRDYDCRADIIGIIRRESNPFKGHVYMHGVLWAYLESDFGILVPPKIVLRDGSSEIYPLRQTEGVRQICVELNGDIHPLCFGIPADEIT